ncbi:Hypothetical predicted protein [Prunus dulcis]|uniref:Uncharacterized protein n=1 Tax=Prunus dulcis TaxID=3755 RepID=A0A5E4EMC3_PRUDU|nr:Hypothetical predicted protein [Prunus dulcis]
MIKRIYYLHLRFSINNHPYQLKILLLCQRELVELIRIILFAIKAYIRVLLPKIPLKGVVRPPPSSPYGKPPSTQPPIVHSPPPTPVTKPLPPPYPKTPTLPPVVKPPTPSYPKHPPPIKAPLPPQKPEGKKPPPPTPYKKKPPPYYNPPQNP